MSKRLGQQDFEELRSSCIFARSFLERRTWLVTGGTGFFGKWLTQALVALHDEGSDHRVVLWTRNVKASLEACPWLQGRPEIVWHEGDIREPLPASLKFDGVIHGATAASSALNEGRPREMFDVIVEGTDNVLAEARKRAVKDLLFISSGGIYGKQPASMTHIPEDYCGGHSPLELGSAYGVGKTTAEFMTACYGREMDARILIARCFAFVGPYLPLDTHFAIGNFMRDVLQGKEIRIGGDGTPYRSFLYGTDLVEWLLKILVQGRAFAPYHVGSERELTIAEIAKLVAEVGEEVTGRSCGVVVAKSAVPGAPASRYVPSTAKTRTELGLQEKVVLRDAVARTLRWHRG